MPIYEYRCGDCGRRASIFFRSISAARNDPRCPHCGGANLERLFSRVVVRRGGGADDRGDEVGSDDAMDGFGAEEYGDDPFGLGADLMGEDADPRELARWTRQMSARMGEPLDAELDQALTDIERGADPDDVLDRLDEGSATDGPLGDPES